VIRIRSGWKNYSTGIRCKLTPQPSHWDKPSLETKGERKKRTQAKQAMPDGRPRRNKP